MENLGQIFETLLFWFGTVVAAASVIVKATPTQKDDAILAKVVKVLDVLVPVMAGIYLLLGIGFMLLRVFWKKERQQAAA